MRLPKLKALGIGVGLFVIVYVPAFVATALVRPRVEITIPLIIAITFLVAFTFVLLLSRPPAGIAEFGFRIPNTRYLATGTALGFTLGVAITLLSHLFPSKPPFDVSRLAPWMIGLYFIIGSPIQEEIIFRGLIQSILERRWTRNFSVFCASLSFAVIYIAAL